MKWFEIKNKSDDKAEIWINGTSIADITGSYGDDTEGFTEIIFGYTPDHSWYNEAIFYWDNFGAYTSDPGNFSGAGWTGIIDGVTNPASVIGVSVTDIDKIIGQ